MPAIAPQREGPRGRGLCPNDRGSADGPRRLWVLAALAGCVGLFACGSPSSPGPNGQAPGGADLGVDSATSATAGSGSVTASGGGATTQTVTSNVAGAAAVASDTASADLNTGGAGVTSIAPTAGAGGAAVAVDVPVPTDIGTKAIHRLSNVEYDNTLRDLLGTQLSFGDGFVREEAEGFDNIATALSMSPRQTEDYFNAALQVAIDTFANPTLRDRILTCTPQAEDLTCAQTIIGEFGARAFRRPLEPTESLWLLTEYQNALGLGEEPTGAMQHVVHVMLTAPQFLYRIEFDPSVGDATPHALTAYELASRLSYALWSSMPDETLFGLAESGALLDLDTLLLEVDRMLEDSRSNMLVENFAAQWLGANRVAEHAASLSIYPSWSPELAAAMQQEMELYFAEFLNGNLPYTEFLTADFNFVDATLAQHYGMTPPAQAGFQRVEDTTDARRGLLGLAGFLTHTSRESRSSPIIRGKWVLDALLCTPLSVPAGLVVEPLPEPAEGDEPTTVRELMDVHRASAACAGCHNLIDPIGLALENFDGIGRYRDQYESGLPIDTLGTLPSGASVDSLTSLTEELVRDEKFVPCVARKFNTYALGRGVSDEGYFAQVLSSWQAGTLTLRDLIKQTVANDTFRWRRGEAL